MLPDFFCVGTYRAGTTWLQSVLMQNPAIFLPKEKELMFFSRYYHLGIDWYETFFREAREDQMIGEICPAYLGNPKSAHRIFSHIPKARIIAILRSPVEQIRSSYDLGLVRGSYKKSLFDTVRDGRHILQNVRYYENLQRYLDFFPRRHVLMLLFEDMVKDRIRFLEKIFKFLQVNPFFPESLDVKVNQTRVARCAALDRSVAFLAQFFRNANLWRIKRLIDATGIPEFLKRKNTAKNSVRESTMDGQTAHFIIENVQEDVRNLQTLLNRNLSHWLFWTPEDNSPRGRSIRVSIQ